MPVLDKVPDVDSCCGFVTDLQAASAIIAVLAIVTSPVISWTLLRHSYVVRVAWYVSAGDMRADVVDLTLNNIISFGFGVNAGLGPTCLSAKTTTEANLLEYSQIFEDANMEAFFNFVKGFGWTVLTFDIIFVIAAFNFLLRIFKNPSARSALVFMICAFIAIFFSCIYGILYVICCMTLGGNLPIFELFFSVFDLALWCYFIVVLNSYRQTIQGGGAAA